MTAENISVSPEVRALLPDVLIDYLWTLALSDKYRYIKVQSIKLDPGKLGRRSIQDIYHINETRHVFGVEPVSCKLRVVNSKDHYKMILAN